MRTANGKSDNSAADHAVVRSVDRELLRAIPTGELIGIGELIDRLGVTATAVRQRVDRMLDRGLIEREKVVAGRGRPTFQYRLTDQGRRTNSADSTELAEAMWQELLAIEDPELRDRMLIGIAKRLGKEYASRLHEARLDGSAPLEDRMRLLSKLLSERRVRSDVVSEGELPVLDISSCPFPTLANGEHDHSMCRLEELLLSEALGKPVHLSQCRKDGDACCQFALADSTEHQRHPSNSLNGESANASRG
ncbi:MarR family transcriptional regulator [Stieleria sp. JC731]|uniref:helix-turn-helix transcriptional regulator n=1 Tax=Pirellulaceae TaxID=2691357 RepID=UPI001E4EEF25|nr:MarR family transcriptional regulator [Stieleria sp. JC731]MCC9599994.1 MarR family transcriptional regulator [Stieleria sp. JC731]